MHVSINIPFTSTKELAVILETLQRDLKTQGVEIAASPTVAVKAPDAPVKEIKNKKKAAPTTPATPTTPTFTTTTTLVADTTPIQITKIEATSALQVLNNTKGLPAARLILSKFKTEKGVPCQRLSELKESDYASFYESCMSEAGN